MHEKHEVTLKDFSTYVEKEIRICEEKASYPFSTSYDLIAFGIDPIESE